MSLRPLVTVDTVVFTVTDDLQVLLVCRASGAWAIPGGTIGARESLEAAARRKLLEETGAADVYLEQLYTFGDPDRDPRERAVSVSYFALVAQARVPTHEADPERLGWFSVYGLPRLALDHGAIIAYAHQRLRWKLDYTAVGFELLPPTFTLPELQRLYEIILNRPLDKRNFRKKTLAMDILTPLGETRREGARRPARLYAFKR